MLDRESLLNVSSRCSIGFMKLFLPTSTFLFQPRMPQQKIPFKRAEKLIKEFRLKQKDSVRLSRQARFHRVAECTATEPKLIIATRIRK